MVGRGGGDRQLVTLGEPEQHRAEPRVHAALGEVLPPVGVERDVVVLQEGGVERRRRAAAAGHAVLLRVGLPVAPRRGHRPGGCAVGLGVAGVVGLLAVGLFAVRLLPISGLLVVGFVLVRLVVVLVLVRLVLLGLLLVRLVLVRLLLVRLFLVGLLDIGRGLAGRLRVGLVLGQLARAHGLGGVGRGSGAGGRLFGADVLR